MTHIINNIEKLQDQLNQMMMTEKDTAEVYTISAELDAWIVKYHKEQSFNN